MNRVTGLVLAILAVAALSPMGAQVPPTTAIRAGRLIDPDAGTSAANQIILVEAGRIKAVGRDVAIPRDASVIDLSKATVLPGLFDAHTHLCMTVKEDRDAGDYFYTTLRDPDSMRAVEGVANARAMLDAGFTSVRDVGNEGNYACVASARHRLRSDSRSDDADGRADDRAVRRAVSSAAGRAGAGHARVCICRHPG